MSDLRSQLKQLLESDVPRLKPLGPCELVIYGAGNAGRAAAKAATDRGFVVHSFLDARATSVPEVDGISCHLPHSSAARTAAASGVPVVVAVFNCATDLQPIFTLLQETGFERVISFYELHEQFGYEPQFWLGSREQYRMRRTEIIAGFDVLDDEPSRQIFYEYIALRLTFNSTFLASPDQEHQYTPTDLSEARSPVRLVDGGAFDGDTIRTLLERGIKLDAVAAFEPDPANFEQLCRRAGDFQETSGNVILFPCGLSNETGIRSFASGAGASSSLDATGEAHIQVVALDDVLPTFAPTFIKLDIEGAEPEALLGARRIITRDQPQLAVCVYHVAEHLWTIPTLIHHQWPNYRLFLRYHHYNGLEVVLYAVPR
jgi:FkbM family methyltransferase